MTCHGNCPCEKQPGETDSMKCCFDSCPANPKINDPYCKDQVCGKDGKTYKGTCAVSECGKTVRHNTENTKKYLNYFDFCLENTM